MSVPVAVADESLDYSYLLIAHMVCADQQIHCEEARSLQTLAQEAGISQRTLEEMEKILAQDEELLPIEYVAQSIPKTQRTEALQQILAIAYIDGYCSPLEREMVEQVSQLWNVPPETIQRLLIRAENLSSQSIDSPEDKQHLSLGARLLRGADSVLSRSLIDRLAHIAPKDVGRRIEQLRQEILLAGPEYDEAIQRCAAIAREDYRFAEIALQSTSSALENLSQSIQQVVAGVARRTTGKGQAYHARDVAQHLERTRNHLTAEIIKELGTVRQSLQAKQRALNYFSIAFMGRTKAGKSTLHAVITGEGWDAIGIGRQRTTRYNRVYEWKNIRVIDTPGIGAPKGRTDEEIAQSVADEADVICYVVTNDSIQETEFNFLGLLKQKAKPLTILLNVKQNLRDSRRLEHFLKSPDRLFEMEGKSGLGGHIERIRRYARQKYGNDYFKIIPVMLLAAQISRETSDAKHSKPLFEASRLQNFLDSIRLSLIEYGPIRRSQTLLGSTVSSVAQPGRWIAQEVQTYQQLTDTLKAKREEIRKNIRQAERDALALLRQSINTAFQNASSEVSSFAEDHWEADEHHLKLSWEKKLKSIKFEEALNTAYEAVNQKFSQEVTEIVEEVGHDLQLITQLSSGSFQFTSQDSSFFDRDFARIGSGLLVVAGTILTFFVPPLGITVGIIGSIASFFTGIFKSRDQKRREAVQSISSSLSHQLEQQRQITLEQAENTFCQYFYSIAASVDEYFDELIQGLEAIAQQLEETRRKLSDAENYLNRAYAKRILDWCLEQNEPLTEERINRSIAKVHRDVGRHMTIYTKVSIQSRKSRSELKEVLQENVLIQTMK